MKINFLKVYKFLHLINWFLIFYIFSNMKKFAKNEIIMLFGYC